MTDETTAFAARYADSAPERLLPYGGVHPRFTDDAEGQVEDLLQLDYFPRLPEIGDRVVWGTDWPSPGVDDLRRNLDAFLGLPLPDDLKQRITRTTPLSVLPPR